MGYVRTAGMSTAARRRRRRTALVLTGLVLLLLAVFLYAVAYYRGWLPGIEEGSGSDAAATTTVAPTLQPADVVVNVYNATERSGLAGRTAEALRARGWAVEGVGNDPERQTVEVADIRFGPDGEDGARLLQEAVPGARLVPDGRGTDKVDLVLGEGFEELPAAETPSPATSTG